MNGLIAANAVAGALASVPARTGAASALLGATQYGSGMVGAAAVGIFADGTPWPMGWVMALAGAGSLASALACLARNEGPPAIDANTETKSSGIRSLSLNRLGLCHAARRSVCARPAKELPR